MRLRREPSKPDNPARHAHMRDWHHHRGRGLFDMQHPPRVYERADEIGLLLLTEVPLIDDHDQSDAFRENLVEQMRELIAQNYNHPSVALWGIGNEIRKSDAASNRILAELNATAKTLDPLRPTTYAHCCLEDSDPIAQHRGMGGGRNGHERNFDQAAGRCHSRARCR